MSQIVRTINGIEEFVLKGVMTEEYATDYCRILATYFKDKCKVVPDDYQINSRGF